jgi:methyl-accepting chemotaxis protein
MNQINHPKIAQAADDDQMEWVATSDISQDHAPAKPAAEARPQAALPEAKAIVLEADQLLAAISEMADAHARGEIDERVDHRAFAGPFATLAKRVNEMVEGHIVTKRQLLAATTHFAEGKFDEPFPTMTGQRAFISDTVASARGNFKKVVGEICRVSAEIASGHLDVKIDGKCFAGDYQNIADGLGTMLDSLNAAFETMSSQVSQTSVAATQMSQSSKQLASNSQIQSASVDEVSASAEETDTQVKANAAAAGQASQLVTGAAAVAEEGREKIGQMVTAMEGIRASSQDIGKIIKVIDEIAFQTNLLALNAAVEAARAGQHGRGFAVVAQEVRNLAGRSAKAARETSELIESAGARVQAGVKIADETSRAFTTIAGDIEKVRSFMREISVASDEQARGVAQINTAMSEAAKTALATSQQADEVAASAAEILTATDRMRGALSRFQLRPADYSRGNGLPDLSNLSPEMLAQVQAMLAAQSARSTPASTLHPLRNADRDERGFSGF